MSEVKALITEEELKAWLGVKHRDKVRKWLDDNSIPYSTTRERIVTTIQAVNAGLIGEVQKGSGFEFL